MAERKTLPQIMQETSQELAKNIKNMADGVAEGIGNQNNNGRPTTSEIAAALYAIGVLAGGLGEVLGKLGESGIIFPNNEQPERKTMGVDKPPPTTFSELLRIEIDRNLLPTETITFTEKALRWIIINNQIYGAKPFLRSNPPPDNSTREEAVSLIKRCLEANHKTKQTPPPSKLEDIAKTWRIPKTIIDKWAEKIGWKWDGRSSITPEEAGAIRGLNRLDKVLGKRSET